MHTYSIETRKDSLKFCAAHMATFADGSIEHLHGHNYQVTARLWGVLDPAGMVLDVGVLRRWVKELCDALDERVLVATQNPLVQVDADAERVRLRYRGKTYSLPPADCILLPIPNTTMEHLGHHLAEQLAERLRGEPAAARMTRLEITVSETPGQSAAWTLNLPA